MSTFNYLKKLSIPEFDWPPFLMGFFRSGVATTLLFVIRDFIGQTPAENLKATLLTDLAKIWDSIKKVLI